MGNYSGTIRCGHCYGQGHNRAGCEKLTEQLQREWEHCKANVDPTSYRYTRVREKLAKRTGIDPITGEATRRRRKTSGGRICSYCKDNGHNRRTCDRMKQDKVRFTALTVEHRANVIKALRKHGVGPGALVAQDEYGTKVPCLVTNIQWGAITRKSPWPSALLGRRVTDNRAVTLSFPVEISESNNTYNATTVLSPAHKVEPPAGWSDAVNLDFDACGLFDKGDSRDWYFWRAHDQS